MSVPNAAVLSGVRTLPVTVPEPANFSTPNPVAPSAGIEALPSATSNVLVTAFTVTGPTGRPVNITVPAASVVFALHPQALIAQARATCCPDTGFPASFSTVNCALPSPDKTISMPETVCPGRLINTLAEPERNPSLVTAETVCEPACAENPDNE